MANKVTNIATNKKLRGGWKPFLEKYPRIERTEKEMHPIDSNRCKVEMEDDPPDSIMYIATKDKPLENTVLFKEYCLDEKINNCNGILAYRILSRIYRKPDILSAGLSIDAEGKPIPEKGVIPLNWGFTFEASENLYVEIRTKYIRRVGFLRFWRKSVLPDSKLKSLNQDAKEFIRRLQGLIDQNLHLFSEDEILNRACKSFCVNSQLRSSPAFCPETQS